MLKRTRHAIAVVAVGLLIVAIQAAVGMTIFRCLPDWPTRGQVGDMFGTVNTMFSGLAFAGLIYTALLQRADLALQYKQIESTRTDLERTALALEQVQAALVAQAATSATAARMAMTTALLHHYRSELRVLRAEKTVASDPLRARLEEVEQREATLLEMLDSEFKAIRENTKGSL